MSRVESLLKLRAKVDLTSLLVAIIKTYRQRPAVGYAIDPYDIGVLEVLRAKGIKVWGIVMVGNELLFQVCLPQAQYTQYWLDGEGVPYRGGPDRPVDAGTHRKP